MKKFISLFFTLILASMALCDISAISQYLSFPNASMNIYYNAQRYNYPEELTANCGITMPCFHTDNYY